MTNPFPSSLGDYVAGWIEERCCHGPGDVYGEKVRLTDEEHAFLEEAYRVNPSDGRRTTDLAMYSRRKGTRKSELGAWLVAAEAIGPVRCGWDGPTAILTPPVDPTIVCVATTENQGELVYGAFRAIVKASPTLERLFDVGLERTNLVGRSGKVELIQSRNAAALDGARPTFEVADEAHLWLELLHETYATIRRNLRKRRAAQPWMFLPTTAYALGEDSIAETLHAAVGQRVGSQRSGRLLVDHRQASERWSLTNVEQLFQAIEEAGGDAYWSDTDAIAAEMDQGVPEWEFRRYWLNQPWRVAADCWLPEGAWEACREVGVTVDESRQMVAAVDMGLKDDTAALCVAQRGPEGRIRANAKLWRAPLGDVIALVDVENEIRRLANTGNLASCVYDPKYFVRSAQALEAEGIVMVENPQSDQRMVPAAVETHRLIVAGQLVHDFDAEQTTQVLNAAPKTAASGNGWRLDKRPGKSRGKIDVAIALAMAVHELTQTGPGVGAFFTAFSWTCECGVVNHRARGECTKCGASKP